MSGIREMEYANPILITKAFSVLNFGLEYKALSTYKFCVFVVVNLNFILLEYNYC